MAADAEDIVQDAIANALKNSSTIRGRLRFYLHACVRSAVVNDLRAKGLEGWRSLTDKEQEGLVKIVANCFPESEPELTHKIVHMTVNLGCCFAAAISPKVNAKRWATARAMELATKVAADPERSLPKALASVEARLRRCLPPKLQLDIGQIPGAEVTSRRAAFNRAVWDSLREDEEKFSQLEMRSLRYSWTEIVIELCPDFLTTPGRSTISLSIAANRIAASVTGRETLIDTVLSETQSYHDTSMATLPSIALEILARNLSSLSAETRLCYVPSEILSGVLRLAKPSDFNRALNTTFRPRFEKDIRDAVNDGAHYRSMAVRDILEELIVRTDGIDLALENQGKTHTLSEPTQENAATEPRMDITGPYVDDGGDVSVDLPDTAPDGSLDAPIDLSSMNTQKPHAGEVPSQLFNSVVAALFSSWSSKLRKPWLETALNTSASPPEVLLTAIVDILLDRENARRRQDHRRCLQRLQRSLKSQGYSLDDPDLADDELLSSEEQL